jgi:hypothetical protein
VSEKESPSQSREEVREAQQPQQAPPKGQGPQRSERSLPDPADNGWGEWSEDVERTYDAPPPAGLNDRQLRVYRKIAWHYGRAGSIPSQKLLAKELDIPLRTLKRDVAVLWDKGWLDIDRRTRRGHRGGGKLKAGNSYFPKVSLNDLPEEAFPQVRPRGKAIAAGHTEGPTPAVPVDSPTEGPTGTVPSAQVAPRGHEGAWPIGDGAGGQESSRSDRGDSPVDNRPNAPTVSESKPREERVSPGPSAELLSSPGGPSFGSVWAEKAWVAARRRGDHGAWPPGEPRPPPGIDEDIAMVLMKLQEAGMLETARVLKVDRRPG